MENIANFFPKLTKKKKKMNEYKLKTIADDKIYATQEVILDLGRVMLVSPFPTAFSKCFFFQGH